MGKGDEGDFREAGEIGVAGSESTLSDSRLSADCMCTSVSATLASELRRFKPEATVSMFETETS